VVRRLTAEGSVPALDPARPVVFTGIGTSLHACRIAAAWTRMLSGGRVRAHALDAHDLALTEGIIAADQVVVVSHRGTKQRPNEVLAMAAAAGARTVAVSGEGAQPQADMVVHTVAQERASTHSISYTAALTVLARMVHGLLGEVADPLLAALRTVPDAMEKTLGLPLAPAAVEALVGSAPAPAFVAGSGLDAVTAEEAALKLKEGTYRWVEGLNVEFGLHGMPAVYSAQTVAYLLRPAHNDGGRTESMISVLDRIGATVLIAGEEGDSVALPCASVPLLARPFVAIVPFQRLVSAAAAVLGASPDLTHMEVEPWASAIKEVRL
jgi:glucosamine--fructose-6-phosphate aminotransferase (isomerizing)